MFRQHGFAVATSKTLLRIVTCRPQRGARRARARAGIRKLLASTGLLGMLAVTGLMFAVPAHAEVTANCYGTVNSTDFRGISLASPLRVRENQSLAIRAGSRVPARFYVVRMYYFGIRYAIRGGTTDQSQWSGNFNASQVFTRGAGNYIVEGFLTNNQTDAVCVAWLYIRVNANPLEGPVGQAAGGITLTGFVGMIATAVTGGKVPPGFDSTTTPEDEEKIKQHQEDEKKDPYEDERKQQDWKEKTGDSMCVFLALPALLLTAGAMSTGGGAVAAAPPRRVRWRPRLSVVGLGSGILFSVGSGVLLQQYGVIWPTIGMGITFLVAGLALGVLVPSLARLRAVGKMNRRLESLNRAYGSPHWTATHVVSEGGAQVWDSPDPSTDAREEVAGAIELQLLQVAGGWTEVRAESGWTGWVDSRSVEPIVAKGMASEAEPAPAEPNAPADWYPDPSGEARLRYWDGSGWTEHVAD
jgi:hypothetical protein